MRRFASAFRATAAVVALAGCGGAPGVSMQPLQPRMPLVGASAETLTVGALRQELLAFADRAMGEMARASGTVLATDSAPATGARPLRQRHAATGWPHCGQMRPCAVE